MNRAQRIGSEIRNQIKRWGIQATGSAMIFLDTNCCPKTVNKMVKSSEEAKRQRGTKESKPTLSTHACVVWRKQKWKENQIKSKHRNCQHFLSFCFVGKKSPPETVLNLPQMHKWGIHKFNFLVNILPRISAPQTTNDCLQSVKQNWLRFHKKSRKKISRINVTRPQDRNLKKWKGQLTNCPQTRCYWEGLLSQEIEIWFRKIQASPV